MALYTNTSRTYNRYKEFYGKNIEQIPLLISENRTPLSISELMKERLNVKANSETRTNLINNNFDSRDAICHHPNGRIKVISNSDFFKEISPERRLIDGAMILEENQYDKLEGLELTKQEKQTYIELRWLNAKQIRTNPILLFLAKDKCLLEDYVNLLKTNGCKRNMKFSFQPTAKIPTMNLCSICAVFDGSGINANRHLDSPYGRIMAIKY